MRPIADDLRRRAKGRRFDRDALAAFFGRRGFQRGAEVGVCTGLYSEVLCKQIPTLTSLLCVDPWAAFNGNRPNGWGRDQAQHDENYAETVARLSAYPQAQIVRRPSLEAAQDVPLGSLDFVYIDGNHRFDFVMQDLIVWGARVRSGGIVAGDDYYLFRGYERGVILAVDAYVEAHGIPEKFLTCNRSRSFCWVQP